MAEDGGPNSGDSNADSGSGCKGRSSPSRRLEHLVLSAAVADRSNGSEPNPSGSVSTGSTAGPGWYGSGPATRPGSRRSSVGDDDGAPTLDGRDADEILETLASRAVHYTGEGWDPDAGGAGGALTTLFAGMAEEVIERLDRLPAKHRRAFVDALGFDRKPPQAARVPVTLSISDGAGDSVRVPTGTRFEAETEDEDDELTFELERGFTATSASLGPVVSVDTDLDHVGVHQPVSAGGNYLFGGGNDQAHRLYLGHPELLELPAGSTIFAAVESDANVEWLYGLKWEYFGAVGDEDEDPAWNGLGLPDEGSDASLPGSDASADPSEVAGELETEGYRLLTDDSAELNRWLTKQALHDGPIAEHARAVTGLSPGGPADSFDEPWTAHLLEFELPGKIEAVTLKEATDLDELGALEEVESCWVRCSIPDGVPPAVRRRLFATQVSVLGVGGGRLGDGSDEEIDEPPSGTASTETAAVAGSADQESNGPSTEPSGGESSFGTGSFESLEEQLSAIEFAHPPDALFADDVPLAVLGEGSDEDETIRPFGRMPRHRNAFYLADDEALTKSGVHVELTFEGDGGDGSDEHPPEVSWEYWNGDGWIILPLEDDTGRAFQNDVSTISFAVPDDCEPTEVSGQEQYWIRARLADGGYGEVADFDDISDEQITDGEYHGTWHRIDEVDEPVFSAITVRYDPDIDENGENGSGSNGDDNGGGGDDNGQNGTDLNGNGDSTSPEEPSVPLSGPIGVPSQLVSENNLEAAVHDPDDRMRPFRGPEAVTRGVDGENEDQALYFGFDGGLDGGPYQLYLALTDATYPPSFSPRVRWEVETATGWEPLSVRDETEGLRETGVVRFSLPAASIARDRFGSRRHWIRARVRTPGGFVLEPYAPALPEGGDGDSGRRCSSPLPTHPPGSGPYRRRPELTHALENTGFAANARSVSEERLGSSDGTPGQTFTVAEAPARDPELWVDESTKLSEGARAALQAAEGVDVRAVGKPDALEAFWVRWEPVDDLRTAGSSDRHFVFEPVTGLVRFGDGTRGAIPPSGRDNLRISYRTGGGAAGNVEPGDLTDLEGSLAFVEDVDNYLGADGGADAESTGAVLDRAGPELRDRNRAVGVADYERLATESARIVERTRCLPGLDRSGRYRPGWVTVLIVPRSSDRRPMPSDTLAEQVVDGLEAHAPATLGGGVPDGRLVVRGPPYVEASVTATIGAGDVSSLASLETSAEEALAAYLHPLTGGDDGDGWPFGELPCVSDLVSELERLNGVDHVADLSVEFESDGGKRTVAMGQPEPSVGPDVLVHAGRQDVSAEVDP